MNNPDLTCPSLGNFDAGANEGMVSARRKEESEDQGNGDFKGDCDDYHDVDGPKSQLSLDPIHVLFEGCEQRSYRSY